MFFNMPLECADTAGAYDDAAPPRMRGREPDSAAAQLRRRPHGSRAPRSLSLPTEEDLQVIAQEASRRAEQRSAISARTKDVEGDKKGKKEAGASKADGAADAGWCLEPLDGWEQLAAAPPPAVSELSLAVDPQKGPGQGAAGRRAMQLKVFCPFISDPGGGSGGKQKPVLCPCRVPEQATVVDVIKTTLRVLREDQGLSRGQEFSNNADHYRLRVAEDDSGKPDEDLPVLDKKTALRRMGFDTLVLCATQPYRRGAGTAAAAAQRAAMPPALEDVEIRVHMVGRSENRRRVGRLLVPPDVVFKDALAVICDRFKKDASRYSLRLCIDGNERDSVPDDPVPITERTLGTLARRHGVTDFILKPKGRDVVESDGSDAEARDDRPAQVFCDWDEAKASRYTEYDVVKINKYGSRQDRVLGVDRDKIYNMMRGVKAEKTKNPERSITDIQVVRYGFQDRPCYFEIDYRPGVCKSGRDQIECASAHEAHEIVTKVRFLLDLARSTDTGRAAKEASGKEDKDPKLPLPAGMTRFLGGLLPTQVLSSPRGEGK
eukprot:TRINITY_DN4111_c2_g1_i1.p1 TRINITY_DN4111_c2_g1~~TRINITY_DN4111_c2_g1_i1.p1  ORF type:complete len:579 (+),score=192.49 TRINITY_DN4111_c2_g1_i1:98-1738(+)